MTAFPTVWVWLASVNSFCHLGALNSLTAKPLLAYERGSSPQWNQIPALKDPFAILPNIKTKGTGICTAKAYPVNINGFFKFTYIYVVKYNQCKRLQYLSLLLGGRVFTGSCYDCFVIADTAILIAVADSYTVSLLTKRWICAYHQDGMSFCKAKKYCSVTRG